MTALDEVTAALYAERFGPPVRSRNSMRCPQPRVADDAGWQRLHELRDAVPDVDIPEPRGA